MLAVLKSPRWRGRPPRLTDAELVTLAVAQAVLGFHCEARWLRFAHAHLHTLFPYLPQRPAYNKRLRAALGLVKRAIRSLAEDTDLWRDAVWTVDSTPVECARSRQTVKRSDLAGLGELRLQPLALPLLSHLDHALPSMAL